MSNLHDGTSNSALPTHATFTDLDPNEGHSSVKQFHLKMLYSDLTNLKLDGIVKYAK